MTGSNDTPSGPGSRPGRRALFSGPYDPGLATGEGEDRPPAPGRSETRPAAHPEPPVGAPRPGRRAFFSDTSRSAPPTHGGDDQDIHAGLTTVVVECRTCLRRTPISLVGLGWALIPSLWLPTRPWPHLMRCPACHRVAWCRIEWPRLRGAD